jgi:L-asparaginase
MTNNHAPALFPVVIINTGGTLNKRYDPLSGDLFVPSDDAAVMQLIQCAMPNLELHLQGALHKDSLEMTDFDRSALAAIIQSLPSAMASAPIIVVHGTDTLNLTAEYLDQADLNRIVIITGAMKPVIIDPIEAALHLGMALGFAAAEPQAGIYVAMHGRVLPYRALLKNRALGVFQALNTP